MEKGEVRWGEGERQKETESGARNQKCESGLPLGEKKTLVIWAIFLVFKCLQYETLELGVRAEKSGTPM